jgi:hypothetical protein
LYEHFYLNSPATGIPLLLKLPDKEANLPVLEGQEAHKILDRRQGLIQKLHRLNTKTHHKRPEIPNNRLPQTPHPNDSSTKSKQINDKHAVILFFKLQLI